MRAFKVGLKLRVVWPKEAYFKRALVQVHAVFSLPDSLPEKEIRKYYPGLCSAQLLGVARALLANATAFSPCGSFVLPFLDISESIKASLSGPAPQQ